jgi:hypothetical protein
VNERILTLTTLRSQEAQFGCFAEDEAGTNLSVAIERWILGNAVDPLRGVALVYPGLVLIEAPDTVDVYPAATVRTSEYRSEHAYLFDFWVHDLNFATSRSSEQGWVITSEESSKPKHLQPTITMRVEPIPATQTDFYIVHQQAQNLFRNSSDDISEDGIETDFSKNLTKLITTYGDLAIKSISRIILGSKCGQVLAGEALRWIGRIKDPATHTQRRWLLEKSLNSPSAYVRDGASLGLVALNDADAIPALRVAIEIENLPLIKKALQQALQELEH